MCRFVSLFSHLHDGSHQFVLWQTDIQGRDTVQQRLFARCQHDGLRTAFQKKRRMFEVRLCRNKIMTVHVRRIVYQSGERRKSADGRYGDKFFQNCLQAQCCQRILFYDCYFRSMLHLGYRLCFSHRFIDSCWRNAISKKRLKKAFSFSKTVFISHFYSFSFGNGSVFVCCTCLFIYRFIMCSVQLRPQCGRN